MDVECYAGHRGEQTPRRFRLGEREIEVDAWLAPDHRYFKVRDAQGDLYILRHDLVWSRWELTCSVAARTASDHARSDRPGGGRSRFAYNHLQTEACKNRVTPAGVSAQNGDMYIGFVVAHSWLRWLVLLLALVAMARALSGRMNLTGWSPADEAAGRWFVISLDVQMLVGLALYLFLSPFTVGIWSDMGAAMGNAALRFWAVEHLAGMLAAAIIAHVGRVRIRRAADPARRHTQALTFYGISLLLIVASVPWPFMAAGRPLFRGIAGSEYPIISLAGIAATGMSGRWRLTPTRRRDRRSGRVRPFGRAGSRFPAP